MSVFKSRRKVRSETQNIQNGVMTTLRIAN